ncbi:MAG: hypothetical protein HY013_07130 [Candidatus Solibacter usitatus]|nr:hypothetical protein [Candidatus Solibacter usitatus]
MMRVAFVCVGNACRSQMAEGFARAYGADVMEVSSAGLFPGVPIPGITHHVMAEKGIDLSSQFPKALAGYPPSAFDLVVNMSGYPVGGFAAVREWTVRDPYGANERVHREVRDQIETLVMTLILELRRPRK